MIIKHEWEILLLDRNSCLDVPEKIHDFTLHLTRVTGLSAAFDNQFTLIPDIILALDEDPVYRGGDLIFELHRKWSMVPIVLVTTATPIDFIWEIYSSGGFGFIRKQDFLEDLFAILMKQQLHLHEKNENNFLVQNLSSLTAHLQEKNAIFKTIVDLITHDTKNLFYYISTIINQIKDKNLKGILDNAVHDLNECILEAYGYLKEEKRIRSAVSLIEGLRLEKKRILLKSHPRIEYTYSSKYLLFIEVSALFKNALVNIIENALKYAPQTTSVTVTLGRKEDKIVVQIIDQGPGIALADRSRIFERHFRSSRDLNLDGSGKGLWITKNIIEKEEGEIVVSDNPGGGTIFTITLPAYRVADFEQSLESLSEWFNVPPLTIQHKAATFRTFLIMQNLADISDLDSVIFANLVKILRDDAQVRNKKHYHKKLNELQKLNPEGKSVLIIDDSIHVHYYLGTHLTQIGFRIAGYARDGAAGVSFYKSLQPDLVTMDSTMPIMSGADAAIEILKLNPEARILFITGVGGHPRFICSVKESLPNRNYRIIKKPFKKELLEEALDKFL